VPDQQGEEREVKLDQDDREEVRYLYETTDMTQKQLAELKDVSQATISKIV
jgi:DNA-binding XRE family transcriptional regulator